jgi:hypothetical protein
MIIVQWYFRVVIDTSKNNNKKIKDQIRKKRIATAIRKGFDSAKKRPCNGHR